jgi:hypothetical protein
VPLQFGTSYCAFVVVPAISWADANADAAASTFLGVHGHLATVTSAAENDFLANSFPTFNGLSLAWLGGQVSSSGIGTWVVGPDTGLNFSSGGAALPGQYASWGGIEPNNAPSAVDMMVGNINWYGITHGQWADDTEATLAGDVQYGGIVGYFVEYEVSAVPAPVITTTAPVQNNATSIRVDGTSDDNISVALYNGTQLVSTTTSDANGNWHIDAIPLTDGTDYSFRATASIGGYVSAPSNVLTFHEDQTPPTVTITSEALSNGRATLSGTITEPSNSISISDF